MELKAILLFTEFPYVNVLYRAYDGEYFVELDDVQAYLIGVGGGAYTVINRTTPLPPLPEPLPEDSPIWVLINNPNVISNGLRYDGVISYTNTTVGSLGAVTFTVNKVGAFRVGNYIFAVSRKGASAGMLKYGQITAINSNNLTINFLEFEGTANLATDEWDIVLTGKKGVQGVQGVQGIQGLQGEPGDSVIVQNTDPTDLISSKVGDLYLNTSSGTIYQRSGITQAQFYAANLQGLVLPNSIWLIKGNLKGDKGDKGDIGLVWKGTYSANTNYAVNDAVTNGTSSYICKVGHTNQPLTNTTYWQIIALGGVKMYKGTHSVSNVATVINHNLALADPSKVIVQLFAADGYLMYAIKLTSFTANSLSITMPYEASSISLTVIIMSV